MGRLEPVSPRLRHSPDSQSSPQRGLTIRGMTKAGRDCLESSAWVHVKYSIYSCGQCDRVCARELMLVNYIIMYVMQK